PCRPAPWCRLCGAVSVPRLPSFPTRRSSDLHEPLGRRRLARGQQGVAADERLVEGAGEAEPGLERRVLVGDVVAPVPVRLLQAQDRKSTRLNSSHVKISYAVFCLKKKKTDPA